MPSGNDLLGKLALVTGASRGIGKAVAERFAREGVRLALCARTEEELTRVADELRTQLHADVLAVKANMTRLNDIRRFVSGAVKKFKRIDILVNNAGGAHVGGILTTDDDAWEDHINLKLLGYIRMAREVIPHMKAGGGGRIINVVGMAGKEPSALAMVPGVTNAALINFTKSLSLELEPDRIAVNAVHPGTAGAPLAGESAAGPNRTATGDDIAGVVAFLASNAAQFINGTSINVDAGRSSGLW